MTKTWLNGGADNLTWFEFLGFIFYGNQNRRVTPGGVQFKTDFG